MIKLPVSWGTRVPQQVPRLAAVFILAAIALIVARHFLIPDTFGEIGHYRAAAIDTITKHTKKYAGQQECALCHSGIMEQRLAGNHHGVSCENCHGPAATHVANPMEVKPIIPRERDSCPRCHAYNPSRPTGFPQIDEIAHNPRVPCANCHDPHAPEPPMVPGTCDACHRQIANQKAVSHHATLECTTCHEAPDEHKAAPHAVRPGKPTQRSFCGGCHAEDAERSRQIPRVNLRTHNPRYLCWQCHYPHFPEAS